MANINNSIFKQYLGTLDQFKAYYASLSNEQATALHKAIVFIHDKKVDDSWNNDGYIFANGQYYTCRDANTNLTASTLITLIEQGNTSGVKVEEVDGKLLFTPVLKEELKALTNVGFVTSGKTWSAGTDLETILNDIFAKEVWYAANFTYTDNLVVTVPNPTLTVTVDGKTATSGTYEIGAPVTVTASLNASSHTGGDKYTVACSTSGNNGFVKNGDTKTRLTSLVVPATLNMYGSDGLTAPTKSNCFANISIADNTISATDIALKSGQNALTVKTTSKSYSLSAAPTDDMKTLTTLSNKGKYYDETTKDGVNIKHTISKTWSETQEATSTITLTGNYKYYYVWSAATCPTIPTSFSGDLDGWTENWGTKTINSTATSMSNIAWVLKPTGTATTIVEPTTGAVTSFETVSTHTNKYGTSYTLYRFPKASAGIAGGANYKDMKLN
jgi:hypothetical protein